MSDDRLPFVAEAGTGDSNPHVNANDSLQNAEWLLGLLNLKGVGNKKALKLAQHFGTFQKLSSASESEVAKIVGLKSFHLEKLTRVDAEQPDDVKIITYFDPSYPSGLRNLQDPPPVLWYRGKIPKQKSLAIVGTRNADDWGRNTTRLLAKMCGERGIVVVSGLALGIDTEAHKGCLETSTPTVAILACDVRHPSPKTNSKLGEEILEKGGCLIAEVPPGSQTESFALVARNRMQAAWSEGLIVTQCGIPSGTLHTARFALELGRKLIVLEPPFQANGGQYEGNWNLVQDYKFDSRIFGGTKKFQESVRGRTRGADIVLKSLSEFEEFLKNA
jgi:DNA processing protein